MKKLLITVIILLICVLTLIGQNYGVATVFQGCSDGKSLDTDNKTIVWKSTDAIMVLNNDFGWEDQIILTTRGRREYVDIDDDGTYEIVTVDTYLTDNAIEYSFVIVNGNLVMVATESQIGEPIYFVGCIKSTITKRPALTQAYSVR